MQLLSRRHRESLSAQVLSEGKYWRERLRKRGHCFFLLLEHWVRHVPSAQGWQPGEALVWKEVCVSPKAVASQPCDALHSPNSRQDGPFGGSADDQVFSVRLSRFQATLG